MQNFSSKFLFAKYLCVHFWYVRACIGFFFSHSFSLLHSPDDKVVESEPNERHLWHLLSLISSNNIENVWRVRNIFFEKPQNNCPIDSETIYFHNNALIRFKATPLAFPFCHTLCAKCKELMHTNTHSLRTWFGNICVLSARLTFEPFRHQCRHSRMLSSSSSSSSLPSPESINPQ